MEQTEHARLMPSAAHVTIECAASVKMQELYPQGETEDTLNGNAAHWIVSSVLNEYVKPSGGAILASQYVGRTAPNGTIITEEMAEAADEYIFEVLNICNKFGLLRTLQVEQRTKAGVIHAENWGTFDSGAYHAATNTQYIWDFKYGHRYVDVYECWQLLNYGIIITNGMPGNTKIIFKIVQPRCFSAATVREWSITVDELRPYRNRLEGAFIEALSENPNTKSGPHCRDCSAKHACKTAQRATEAAIDCTFNFTGNVQELGNIELGTALNLLDRAADAIDLLKTGFEEDAIQRGLRGQQIPGWDLVQSMGRQVWNRPVNEIIELGKIFEVDLKKPDAVITPKQALKKGIDDAVIEAYSKTPTNGLKLKKDDGTYAARVFKQQRGNETNE